MIGRAKGKEIHSMSMRAEPRTKASTEYAASDPRAFPSRVHVTSPETRYAARLKLFEAAKSLGALISEFKLWRPSPSAYTNRSRRTSFVILNSLKS
ncbi:hypothetical protein EVAR_76471_1 [Eumeta japonica]|uniref:Uncharacterized protein n=1 Tax=Eumeta variegata TaxID=151549 RepID=A0A4C1T4T9_EUMVA|nr:hypothetical protein EVAR_76471_1 [Eumeta japonica]